MSRGSAALTLVVPNLLTFARFGLAAAFLAAEPEWWPTIVVLAAVSDAFDGAFSRFFHATTTFGQILDPIADKAFVGVVLLTLLARGELTLPMLLFVAARDLAVAFGVAVALARIGSAAIRRMPPRWPGKATTALQFLFLAWVVYDRGEIPVALIALTGTVSVIAGLDYLRNPHWKTPEVAAPTAASIDATADLQHPQGDRRA